MIVLTLFFRLPFPSREISFCFNFFFYEQMISSHLAFLFFLKAPCKVFSPPTVCGLVLTIFLPFARCVSCLFSNLFFSSGREVLGEASLQRDFSSDDQPPFSFPSFPRTSLPLFYAFFPLTGSSFPSPLFSFLCSSYRWNERFPPSPPYLTKKPDSRFFLPFSFFSFYRTPTWFRHSIQDHSCCRGSFFTLLATTSDPPLVFSVFP